ncbi:hypothetical protein APE_0722b [Aeropyrum pernix ovoid virus 1]|uniref:Uncharacterized protein n=2 Tax=root TaxID=1 RepID=Q05E55_AERPE|nr:hypothetical protein [Aeropyrum pernix]YP_009177658.1 hypothetical protein ASQ65_gp07 [Aeropyrum pernix ovoid virus 1]BAF34746.1 hypothetical protein APE_0722b [Aeropyrum pernix ovoid virus 1] [Aeropyrum pernix K1]CCD22148.1 TPA: hypothetical protein [Aeropyrum pernix ovoid virus 1]
MSGCEREAILRLLVKLKREMNMRLAGWPEARKRALEAIELYEAELEELLAEEPTFGK